MRRTVMISAVVSVLAVAGAVSASVLLASTAISAPAQAAANERRVTFAIENMTCALCPITVRKAIERVDGVRSVAVDFDSKTATVLFDSSRTSVAKIAAASTNAGYPARAASD